jgi:hypothetical protein
MKHELEKNLEVFCLPILDRLVLDIFMFIVKDAEDMVLVEPDGINDEINRNIVRPDNLACITDAAEKNIETAGNKAVDVLVRVQELDLVDNRLSELSVVVNKGCTPQLSDAIQIYPPDMLKCLADIYFLSPGKKYALGNGPVMEGKTSDILNNTGWFPKKFERGRHPAFPGKIAEGMT